MVIGMIKQMMKQKYLFCSKVVYMLRNLSLRLNFHLMYLVKMIAHYQTVLLEYLFLTAIKQS